MSPEEWERVQRILHDALEREEAEREAFVAAACAGDQTLEDELVSLLHAYRRGGLQSSPDDLDAPRPGEFERLKKALASRYSIDRPLGAGGMATVYLANDLKHTRRVAIKVLYGELSATLGADRFLREIRIAARLRHPNILPLYDSGETDDFLYYVMPVEVETLRHRLKRETRLPLNEVCGLAREVLDALDYAHAEGIVHRDIKPENILLSRGHAVVADFGIARALRAAGAERITQAGMPIGTPAYMSPEQLMGDPRLDGRSDIYSVACVISEMISGVPPVPGRGYECFDQCTQTLTVPPGLRRAIRRALEPDPAKRYGNAGEFAAALSSTSTPEHRPKATEQSIAVLPFRNMSADTENEYFSDGITEEIINALTKLKGLRVAARTSSFAFKGKTDDIGEIGRRLGVSSVLEGSVRRVGTHLRITAQLVTVADGYHVWSERYDRELDDVFAIQDEIAGTIADRLHVQLAREADAQQKPPTEDIEAYQSYLKGRHLWNRRTREGLTEAIDHFQHAIERDAGYAAAFAGIADAYLLLGSYGHVRLKEAVTHAKTAVEKALELDDTLAEAHATLGQILRHERQWKAEEDAYVRAIAIKPGYATAHQWYATLLVGLGRFEHALEEIRRAEQLDPLSHAISVTVAVVLFMSRDFDGAKQQLDRALKLEPSFASTHAWLSMVHAEAGRLEEAERASNRAMELNPNNYNQLLAPAYAHARWGNKGKAKQILARVEERGGSGWNGVVWAALGETDKAFAYLEQAIEKAPSWDFLVFLKVFPWFDPLRSDPRFEALLRRLNLTDLIHT